MTYKARKTILIVDDQTINRVLLRSAFSEHYDVCEARDGHEAMDMLSRIEVCAVVLDIFMPEMDGFEVLSLMRDNEALRRLPVIVVTGSEDLDGQNRALDLGALDVIVKPFNPKIVRRRVFNLIERMDAASMLEQNKWRAELERVRETDERTGLWNKTTFMRETARVISEHPERSYVLVRWDIDRFSAFNDSLGMAEGDRLLKRIGDSFRETRGTPLKSGMLTYGHWDADHFVCLWDKALLDTAALQRYTENRLRELYPTYSFGVRFGFYEIDDPSLDVGVMCDRALMALRSAKNDYDTRCAWYDASMRHAVLEELSITSMMKDALAHGEFVPFYQPQYNFDSGALIGAEALVRWRTPKGFMPPSKFIPVFEKNGFILEMDMYIWERVCADLKRWRDAGVDLPSVSVNVSRRDLYHPRLAGVILDMVLRHGLQPSSLHLEITESAYMDNPEQLLRTVDELKNAGFRVEMDDFGSGYSSLNTLKDVPVDLLKMDMRFMTKASQHGRGGSIVSSVVRMAHSISLPVIAEGVETLEHAQYLSSIGCPYMQGYLFARPMSANDFSALLTRESTRFHIEDAPKPGVDNAADFLEADTQSTLLFNSFLGGAGILEYNSDRVFALRLNDRFFETLGTTRMSWGGHQTRLLKAFIARDRDRFIRMIKEAIATGGEAACDLCFDPVDRGGEPGGDGQWVFCRVRSLAHKASSSILYLSVENITERKRLARHNEKLSAHLSAIMNSAPGGVLTFEIEDGVVRVTYYNDTVATMFGFTRQECDETFKRDPFSLVHPDDALQLWNVILSATRRAIDTATVRFRHICKDKSWRWVQLTGSAISRQDRLLTISAILMDVDSQVRSERLNELYGNMIQSLPLGLLAYERSRAEEPLYINDIAREYLGLTGKRGNALKLWLSEQLENALYKPGDIKRLEDGELVEHTHVPVRDDEGRTRYLRLIAHGARREGKPLSIYVTLVDITESVRAEQLTHAQSARLRQRQEELDAIIDSVPGGIFKYSVDTDEFSYVSQTLLNMLGYTREAFDKKFGGKFTNLIYFEDRAQALAKIRTDISKTGETDSCMYRIETSSGALKWVYDAGRLTTDEHGRQWFVVVVLDMDDRKRLEESLRRESDRVMALIENTPGGIISFSISDFKARPEYVSPGFCRMTGYTEHELLTSMHVHSNPLVHPDDAERILPYASHTLRDGAPFDQEYRVLRKNGEYTWVHMHGVFVGERPGEGMFYGSYTNLSHVKELEANIERDRNEIDTLVNAIPGGIATYEVLEHGLKLVFASEGVSRLSGRTPEQLRALLADCTTMGVWPPDEPTAFQAIRACVENDSPLDVTFRVQHMDGRLIWLNMRGARVGEQNGHPMLYAVYHNLSRSTDLYQQVINASENVLIVGDLNTHEILFANDVASRHGISPGVQPEGALCHQYLYGRPDMCEHCMLSELADAPLVQTLEHEGRVYRSHLTPIQWNGRAAYIISREDITAEVTANRRLEAVLRGAPGGLCIFRIEGSDIRRTYMSESAYATLGYADGEMPESDTEGMFARVHEDDRAMMFSAVMNGIRCRGDLNIDVRILPTHEQPRWVNLTAVYSREENGALIYYGLYTDVNARHEMEDSLRLKHEQYRVVAAQSGRRYYLYDLRAREAIFETEQDNLFFSGDRVPDFVESVIARGLLAPGYEQPWREFFRLIESGERTGNTRLCFQLNGLENWFGLTFTAIQGRDGRYDRAVISFQNITTERALRKSHMQQRTGMFSALSALYAVMTACNLTRNEYQSLKREPGDTRRAGSYDELFAAEIECVPEAERALYRERFTRESLIAAFERGAASVSLQHRRVSASGEIGWSETLFLRANNEYDADVLALALSRSIDEQKLTEETLKTALSSASGELENRVYYGQLLDNLAPGVMTVYYLGDPSVAYLSGSMPSLGYTPAELSALCGGDLLRLCVPEDASAALRARDAAIARGDEYYELEYRVRAKNGGVVWMEQRARRFTDRFGRAGYATLVVDGTRERRMRDRLRIGEEETRLSMEQMGKMICRYDIESRTLLLPARYARMHGVPEVCRDMPECPEVIDRLSQHPNVARGIRALFERIHSGEPRGGGEVCFDREGAPRRWESAEFIVIPDETGRAARAIIAIEDTTARHAQSDENERLRFGAQLLRLVTEHSERMVYYYDAALGTARAMDEERSRQNGLSPVYTPPRGDAPAERSHQVLMDDTRDALREIYKQIADGAPGGSTRIHMRDMNGREKWFDLRFSTLPPRERGARDAVLSLLDVTALHEQELQFISYRQAMERSISTCALYVETDLWRDVVLKLDGRILHDYPGLELGPRDAMLTELLARYRESPAARGIRDHFNRDRLLDAYKAGTRSLREVFELSREGAPTLVVSTETLLLEDPYTRHIRSLTLVYDETEERARRRAAETDALTGLLNRGAVEARIRQMLKEYKGEMCALVLIDLDNLKAVNDAFGHQEGDRALRLLADTLRAHFTRDDLIARIGGDEYFVFIRHAAGEHDVRFTLAALLRRLALARVGADGQWSVRVSVGCARGMCGQDSFETLYQNADIALGHVKRNGKNDFALYTQDMLSPGYRFGSHADLSLTASELQDPREVRRLLAALSRYYTLVLALQPKQNAYVVMEIPGALTARVPGAGTLDELHAALLPLVLETDRKGLMAALGWHCPMWQASPHQDTPICVPEKPSRIRLTWQPPAAPPERVEALLLALPGEPDAPRLFLLARAVGEEEERP